MSKDIENPVILLLALHNMCRPCLFDNCGGNGGSAPITGVIFDTTFTDTFN